MSQWSSFFAEQGLQVPKAIGDLLGPCTFALLMGTTRAVYGAFADRFPLEKALVIAGFVCMASYLLAVFSPSPILSLVGCGFCGLSVGLMWPGVFNLCAKYCAASTALFALLALAGDLGCSAGPSVVSSVTAVSGGMLKAGLLAATAFPLLLTVVIFSLKRFKKHN